MKSDTTNLSSKDMEELKRHIDAMTAKYFATMPQPDPQYAVPAVSEILDISSETVRTYFELPRTHPHRLPYVDTTGTARGYRVQLSELSAWQQRNRPDLLTLELPVRRPARRQRNFE